jgi:hypothetical protein
MNTDKHRWEKTLDGIRGAGGKCTEMVFGAAYRRPSLAFSVFICVHLWI